MPLVEVARFYNSFDAAVARSQLMANGIESVLFDTEMNWGGLDGVVPVRLMALDEDRDTARRLLMEAGLLK